jgi:anti-sigma factor RsiW
MSCDTWRDKLGRDKLDAYADESLTPEQLAGIEDHLRTCTSCAAEALSRVQLKRATRAAAAQLTSQPEFRMRPEFRLSLEKSLQKKRRPLWKFAWLPGLVTTAVALLLISVSTIVLTRHEARKQALAELLDMHVATLASANPVDVVSTDRHTVKPWFQGKLPFTFNLPDLDNSSFKLLGGKLVYFQHSPGAQLLFELRKHQLSVFILQDQPGIIPQQIGVATTQQKGFNMETWSQAGLHYVIISDTNSDDVHALGELLRSVGR